VLLDYFETNFAYDCAVLLILLIYPYTSDYILFAFFYKLKPYSLLVKRIEESFYFSPHILHYLQLAKLFFLVIFFSHLLACLWIAISNEEDQGVSWLNKSPFVIDDW
jgi:hypothetical protein